LLTPSVDSPFSAFLPQDKVGEFAKMSSQELLKETQKAAGHPKMTEWHQTLIKLGKEQRELEGVSFLVDRFIACIPNEPVADNPL
jgi:chromosome segregation ATPase